MANVLLLVVAMLLPTLVGLSVVAGVRVWRRLPRQPGAPVSLAPPIERIAADLSRLDHQRREFLAEGPGPGRGLRARALTSAYVDVLTSACRALDVVPPRGAPGRLVERGEIDRVEAELRQQGLRVGSR